MTAPEPTPYTLSGAAMIARRWLRARAAETPDGGA